jgi:hypothetical protein
MMLITRFRETLSVPFGSGHFGSATRQGHINSGSMSRGIGALQRAVLAELDTDPWGCFTAAQLASTTGASVRAVRRAAEGLAQRGTIMMDTDEGTPGSPGQRPLVWTLAGFRLDGTDLGDPPEDEQTPG